MARFYVLYTRYRPIEKSLDKTLICDTRTQKKRVRAADVEGAIEKIENHVKSKYPDGYTEILKVWQYVGGEWLPVMENTTLIGD